MKKILLFISIFISHISYSQLYDLSGKWPGIVKIDDEISKIKLNKRLDTCRIKHIESGYLKNVLLRDDMTFYKSLDDDVYQCSSLQHMHLFLKYNMLIGIRTDRYYNFEIIIIKII